MYVVCVSGHLYFAYVNKTEDHSKSASFFQYRCITSFLLPNNGIEQKCDYALDIGTGHYCVLCVCKVVAIEISVLSR
jgi:hypothetical protein